MGGVDNVLKQSFVNAQKATSAEGTKVTSGELSSVISGMRSRGVSDALINDAIGKLPAEMQTEYRKVFQPKAGGTGDAGKPGAASPDLAKRKELESDLKAAKGRLESAEGELGKWSKAEKDHYAENGHWDNPKPGHEGDKAGMLQAELFYSGKKAAAREDIAKAQGEITKIQEQIDKLPKVN